MTLQFLLWSLVESFDLDFFGQFFFVSLERHNTCRISSLKGILGRGRWLTRKQLITGNLFFIVLISTCDVIIQVDVYNCIVRKDSAHSIVGKLKGINEFNGQNHEAECEGATPFAFASSGPGERSTNIHGSLVYTPSNS